MELLNELLAVGFACRSVDAGLLGDPDNLKVAGDGMPFTIHADGNGKKTCSCPPSQPCKHPRRFSSPDAAWGRDSSRDIWFYGNHFYELTAKGIEEAPLYLLAAKASVHDSVPGFLTIYGASQLYSDYQFDQYILDSAHDNHPTYRLL